MAYRIESMQRDYDAIIVGASFAGLAVARQLRGEVLLLDRNEVGAVQTSACGTPLWVLQALGVEESVLQVHERLVFRTPGRTVIHDLSDVPFCTFDYAKFCRGLLAQSRARFLRAGVTGLAESGVETSEGRFGAPLLVDCSGWRGVLVNNGVGSPFGRSFSFAIETKAPAVDDGLFFWLDSRIIPRGIAWLFPVADGSLIGLGSYAGETKLTRPLRRFLEELRTGPGRYHGTYFPHALRPATAGRIFAVGDAAGQCLPLTAEGIRPAVFFGQECGKIVQQILDGRLSHAEGLAAYRTLVDRFRWAYRWLRRTQWFATHAPSRWLGAVAALAYRPHLRARWWPRYGRFGPLDAALPASPSPLPETGGLGHTWGPMDTRGFMGGTS